MPGVIAILGAGSVEQRRQDLSGMVATMLHEPFYVSGVEEFPEMGVWAGWVAAENSLASRVSRYRHADGSALLFCGECFPSTDGLYGEPHRSPESFAAAVIEGCREQGPDHLKKLNGLFSGVLIDRTRRQCTVFNDRFGSERLYRHDSGDTTWLASEAKAILHVCPAVRAFDREGVAQFLKFNSVIDGRTLFRGIDILPGASALWFTADNKRSQERYFDAGEWESLPRFSVNEYTERLSEALANVVPRYLCGDQPIALSITGGLDTRMIAAALGGQTSRVSSYTFGGLSGDTLDARIGRDIARRCGLDHETIRLDQQWLDNFAAAVDRTVWISDGCAGATTAHEIHLTGLGRGIAPVRLTGNFGSEILRGMSTLNPSNAIDGFLDPEFAPAFEMASAPVYQHAITRSAFHGVPLHLFGSLAIGRSQVTFRTPYLDNEIVELAYRAPAEVFNSVGPSVQAIERLAPDLSRIPTDRGVASGQGLLEQTLRRACAAIAFKLDYLDKEGLPGALWPVESLFAPLRKTSLLGQHKYLAYRGWFRTGLNDYVSITLAEANDLDGIVNPEWRRTAARRHASGRQNLLRPISAAITLARIQQLLLNASTPQWNRT